MCPPSPTVWCARAQASCSFDSEMPLTLRPPGGCQVMRHRAPAAADLEHARAGHGVEQRRHALELGPLRVGERLPVRLEQRRGVVHGRVEPQLVERVAEVVVKGDVPPAAALGVAVQRVSHGVGRARETAAARRVGDRPLVPHDQREQVDEVVRAPVAPEVALREADLAVEHHLADGAEVVQDDVRVVSGLGRVGAVARRRAVRPGQGQLPVVDAGEHPVEPLAEHAAEQLLEPVAERRRRNVGTVTGV